jgi:anti-sigma B factor antagonist
MKIKVEYVHGVIVVEVKGDITGGPDAIKLQDKIKELINEGQKKIVLDISHVHRINSSGIGVLISSLTSAKNAGGDLKLYGVNKHIENLLTITRLITVFEHYEDKDEAIKSFQEE